MSIFSNGNKKLGKDTLIFNMTSYEDCPCRALGLCTIADVCYAKQPEVTWPAVLPHRTRQAAFWSACSVDEFIGAFKAETTNDIKYLRVSEAGDFKAQADVEKLNLIAAKLKVMGIITYLYTHRSDLDLTGKEFVVNGSDFMADNEFRFIPKGKVDEKVHVMCPGDCRACYHCKGKNGLVIGVNEH